MQNPTSANRSETTAAHNRLVGGRLEHFFETLPVDRIPQQDQLVLRIDNIPQQDLEEVCLNGGGGVTFRHHFRGLPLQFTWFYARRYNTLRTNNQLLF